MFSLLIGMALGWCLSKLDWSFMGDDRRIALSRKVPLPILHLDDFDAMVDANEPIDWLDIEIFGDPVMARKYRLEAPDMHRAIREAVLATLPERDYRRALKTLLPEEPYGGGVRPVQHLQVDPKPRERFLR
jgi:hypothetical protein